MILVPVHGDKAGIINLLLNTVYGICMCTCRFECSVY